MVWNSSSSTLYKAVERHNNTESSRSVQEKEHFYPPPPEREHREYRHNIQQNTPIAGLLQDKDALLIVALILILIHEKADMKLILALAFVLLS